MSKGRPGTGTIARHGVGLALGLVALAAGCQKPTAVDFQVEKPENALLDPFSLAVSDYVLKGTDGSIIAAVSLGAEDNKGRLPLGELSATLSGDLRLDVMSGPQLVGMAHVHDVSVDKGKTTTWLAAVRKPLVVVGADAAPEGVGTHAAPELLDPTTSTDLQSSIKLPEAQAAAFTSDGTHLILGSTTGLYVVDTGTGVVSAPATMPFAPSIVALAANDAGIAFVERGTTSSRVLWFPDVAALVASPSTAMGTSLTITTGVPRAAHFSPAGDTLYVLVETAGDEPCTGTTAPQPNQIVPMTTAGLGTALRMSSYVADFAVEPNGSLLLAQAVANELAVFDTSAHTTTKVYAATCPSAVELLGDEVYAVTNDGGTSSFDLLHGRYDGSTTPPQLVPITLPSYGVLLTDTTSQTSTPSNSHLEFAPVAIVASELAVAPDGTSAVLATRARYRQTSAMGTFDIIGLDCSADVDVVEYGLYAVDLGTGTASYSVRSQNVIVPAATTPPSACVTCSKDLMDGSMLVLNLECDAKAGDRAAGLAASFSEAQ